MTVYNTEYLCRLFARHISIIDKMTIILELSVNMIQNTQNSLAKHEREFYAGKKQSIIVIMHKNSHQKLTLTLACISDTDQLVTSDMGAYSPC